MITLGFVPAVVIPAAVLVGAIVWPEHITEDRTVGGIQARVEPERGQERGRRHSARSSHRATMPHAHLGSGKLTRWR